VGTRLLVKDLLHLSFELASQVSNLRNVTRNGKKAANVLPRKD
jgi:hypothetical protein